MSTERKPWPESNPNDGPLWVQWEFWSSSAHKSDVLRGNGWCELLTRGDAEAIARQLGQPLPAAPRTERVQWHEAVRDMRLVPHELGAFRAVEITPHSEHPLGVAISEGGGMKCAGVAPDGTVEVLVEDTP